MKRYCLLLTNCLIVLTACGSAPDPPETAGQETIIWAQHMMDLGNHRAASEELEKLVLNYPDRDYSDKAQYLLGEAHLYIKEYILAESAFRMLLTSYPGSEYRDDAEFGIALCLSRQAPKHQLDQSATESAIRALERFMEDYPSSPLIASARSELKSCNQRLSQKLLDAARHYVRRGRCSSAQVYLDEIISSFSETPSSLEAMFLTAECHRKSGRLEQAAMGYTDLLDIVEEENPLRGEVVERLAKVRKELQVAGQS